MYTAYLSKGASCLSKPSKELKRGAHSQSGLAAFSIALARTRPGLNPRWGHPSFSGSPILAFRVNLRFCLFLFLACCCCSLPLYEKLFAPPVTSGCRTWGSISTLDPVTLPFPISEGCRVGAPRSDPQPSTPNPDGVTLTNPDKATLPKSHWRLDS